MNKINHSLNNLSIKSKIIGIILSSVILFITINLYIIFTLNYSIREYSVVRNEIRQALEIFNDNKSNLTILSNHINIIAEKLAYDESLKDSEINQHQIYLDKIEQKILFGEKYAQKIKNLEIDTKVKNQLNLFYQKLADSYKNNFLDMKENTEMFFDAINMMKLDSIFNAQQNFLNTKNKLEAINEEFNRNILANFNIILDTNIKKSKLSLIIIISLILIVAIVIIFSYLIIIKSIAPILNIIKIQNNVAKTKDLTKKIDFEKNDEIGQLADSFNFLLNSFKQIILKSKNTSNLVSYTSIQLTELFSKYSAWLMEFSNKTAKNIVEGAKLQDKEAKISKDKIHTIQGLINKANKMFTEQVKQSNNVTNLMKKIDESARKTEKDIKNIAETSSDTIKFAQEGKTNLDNSRQATIKIQETVIDIYNKITYLEEHSKRIKTIVSIINEITNKINLLSLNASIASAKAGEHGKEFAVIAGEIRMLAKRSAKSTTEISDTLKGLQDITSTAVEGITKGRKKVEEGVLLEELARKSFLEILSAIEGNNTQIQNISSETKLVNQNIAKYKEIVNYFEDSIKKNSDNFDNVYKFNFEIMDSISKVVEISNENIISSKAIESSERDISENLEQGISLVNQINSKTKFLDATLSEFKL